MKLKLILILTISLLAYEGCTKNNNQEQLVAQRDTIKQLKVEVDSLYEVIHTLSADNEKLKDDLRKKEQAIKSNNQTIKQLNTDSQWYKRLYNLLIAPVFGLFLLSVLALLLIYYLHKKTKKKIKDAGVSSKTVTPPVSGKSTSVPGNLKKSVVTHPKKKSEQWLVVGSSVIGKSHLTQIPLIPCQDSHYLLELENSWGIAIVCDGAGSAKNSHLGSAHVAESVAYEYRDILKKHKWANKNELPDEITWGNLSKVAFKDTLLSLNDYANSEKLPLDSLACTLIVVVYSPIGLLCAHIGDGRAGYADENKEWHPMMKPFKGEEANQTVFLTSIRQETDYDRFIETTIIDKKPTAFTLMSDGCENHAFQTGSFDKLEQRYIEMNHPFAGFFDPVVQTLKKMHTDKLAKEEINRNWEHFLKSGTVGLEQEQDDKTMIVGIILE